MEKIQNHLDRFTKNYWIIYMEIEKKKKRRQGRQSTWMLLIVPTAYRENRKHEMQITGSCDRCKKEDLKQKLKLRLGQEVDRVTSPPVSFSKELVPKIKIKLKRQSHPNTAIAHKIAAFHSSLSKAASKYILIIISMTSKDKCIIYGNIISFWPKFYWVLKRVTGRRKTQLSNMLRMFVLTGFNS